MPTPRKCVDLVTRGHFRSCNTNNGRTIRSTVAENTMIHINLIVLSIIERELWSIAVLNCGNRDFRHFCSCDVDLDTMTFIYKLDPYSLDRACKYDMIPKNFLREGFWNSVWQTDRQTDRQTSPANYPNIV